MIQLKIDLCEPRAWRPEVVIANVGQHVKSDTRPGHEKLWKEFNSRFFKSGDCYISFYLPPLPPAAPPGLPNSVIFSWLVPHSNSLLDTFISLVTLEVTGIDEVWCGMKRPSINPHNNQFSISAYFLYFCKPGLKRRAWSSSQCARGANWGKTCPRSTSLLKNMPAW